MNEKIKIHKEEEKVFNYSEIIERFYGFGKYVKLLSDETKREYYNLYEDEENIKDIINKVGYGKYVELMKKMESEFKAREGVIKNFFEKINNLGADIVQKYFSQNYQTLRTSDFWRKVYQSPDIGRINFYFIDNMDSGNFDFVNELDFNTLRDFADEFEKLDINPSSVLEKNKELQKRKRIAERRGAKQRKKILVDYLSKELINKHELFAQITARLGLSEINNKALESCKPEDLAQIEDLFRKIKKNTKELGGDEYEEEDLLLGLEEL